MTENWSLSDFFFVIISGPSPPKKRILTLACASRHEPIVETELQGQALLGFLGLLVLYVEVGPERVKDLSEITRVLTRFLKHHVFRTTCRVLVPSKAQSVPIQAHRVAAKGGYIGENFIYHREMEAFVISGAFCLTLWVWCRTGAFGIRLKGQARRFWMMKIHCEERMRRVKSH